MNEVSESRAYALSDLQLCTSSSITHKSLTVELVFQTIPIDSPWNTARQIQARDILKFLPALTVNGSRTANSTTTSEFSVQSITSPVFASTAVAWEGAPGRLCSDPLLRNDLPPRSPPSWVMSIPGQKAKFCICQSNWGCPALSTGSNIVLFLAASFWFLINGNLRVKAQRLWVG